MSNPLISTTVFNLTGNGTLSESTVTQINDQFTVPTTAILALTVVNLFAALLTAALVLGDNIRLNRTWKLDPSRRIPFSVALGIVLSHVAFILKDLNGLKWWDSLSHGNWTDLSSLQLPCMVYNQLGFWGTFSLVYVLTPAIWLPFVIVVVRVVITGAGIALCVST